MPPNPPLEDYTEPYTDRIIDRHYQWLYMGFWAKVFPEYDEYRISANKTLNKVRAHCHQKYGDGDRDVLHEEVGKRLQYYIDARNNQGGSDANRYALAYWQIFRALYPEYIQDEPPTLVPEIWKTGS